jgi:hypothetical protein
MDIITVTIIKARLETIINNKKVQKANLVRPQLRIINKLSVRKLQLHIQLKKAVPIPQHYRQNPRFLHHQPTINIKRSNRSLVAPKWQMELPKDLIGEIRL